MRNSACRRSSLVEDDTPLHVQYSSRHVAFNTVSAFKIFQSGLARHRYIVLMLSGTSGKFWASSVCLCSRTCSFSNQRQLHIQNCLNRSVVKHHKCVSICCHLCECFVLCTFVVNVSRCACSASTPTVLRRTSDWISWNFEVTCELSTV